MSRGVRNSFVYTIGLLSLMAISTRTAAQAKPDGTTAWIKTMDSLCQAKTPEKLYLQTDKAYYAIGDTIWFKAYLLRAGLLTPSQKSGIIYVELLNDSARIVKHLKLPVQSGIAWAQLPLTDDGEMIPGNYVLRAYSNWQRNASESYMFKTAFTISGRLKDTWFAKAEDSNQPIRQDNNRTVRLNITNGPDGAPLANTDVAVTVRQGESLISKANLKTSAIGQLSIGFTPKDNNRDNLKIVVEDISHRVIVPLTAAEQPIDLQFMPEGGHLVAGLPSKVGFKAIYGDGSGIDVAGVIRDEHGQEIVRFKSIFKGIGTFSFTPRAGSVYTALLAATNGETFTYHLPVTQPSGVTMQVISNPLLRDTLTVRIRATADVAAKLDEEYVLIGQAQGLVCMAGRVHFADGNFVNTIVRTDRFPAGIVVFTLFDAARKPVCERSVFIDHPDDNLKINISTGNAKHAVSDSIPVEIRVTDNSGKPLQGDFSMAVTDDGQVAPDAFGGRNMVNQLLLGDDLKGEVEDPGHYIDGNGVCAPEDLDNLLLTQGWTSYNWLDVFPAKPLLFAAEPVAAIRGKVTNTSGKAVGAASISFFSKKPLILTSATTDKDGWFTSNPLPYLDTTMVFFGQAKDKKGKENNVNIEIAQLQPPPFKMDDGFFKPLYPANDAVFLNFLKTTEQQHERNGNFGRMLGEVKITSNKTVKGSHNLNGPGNADFILDEKDIDQAKKMPLLELLEQKIKGFHVGRWPILNNKYFGIDYLVTNRRVQIIFNGVDIDRFYDEANNLVSNGHYEFIKDFLSYYNASDIKGVELINTNQHDVAYDRSFHPIYTEAEVLYYSVANEVQFAYIEITSRSGEGPFIKPQLGSATYRYEPFTFPKEFYKPKYFAKVTSQQNKDMRSTLYWEPNVITDANGKANVSFHSSDVARSYTIRVEGTDLRGKIGSSSAAIKVDGTTQ